MKIIIRTTNLDSSQSINQYIEEKIGGLDKFLKSFDPELIEARVEVAKTVGDQRSGEIYKAEVNLSVNGDLIRVDEKGESVFAAIDLAKDELARRIREYKDKTSTKFIRGARSWKKFWQVSPLARFRKSKVNKILKTK